MTETITWHQASEPPDNDRKVLLLRLSNYSACGLGWYLEKLQPGWPRGWYEGSRIRVPAPDYWAELPRGPQT